MRLLTLSPDQILPPLVPARESMEEEAFGELVEDVRANGVRTPVIVTPAEGGFRLVAGHRRWLAAQAAGLAELPAVVKELSDLTELGEMIAENLHREQLSPLDEGRVFAVLLEHYGHSVASVATLVKKSGAYVQSRLRVLHSAEDVREALRQGLISFSVALELDRCDHHGDRSFLLSHAISSGATADTARRWVVDAALNRRRQPEAPAGAGQVVQLEQPKELMGYCDWGRHEIPLNTSLMFRVCGDHHTFLQQLRQKVAEAEAGGDHAAG